MTPQILLDALRRAFQTLDTVQLIVFDECHCARGNHPYARIMKVPEKSGLLVKFPCICCIFFHLVQ